ncbi:hypothetical protein N7527_011487 [Penicillium freii]|uniref:Uncharacterized protein n=1 Tax=Penicillium freii TaxID=48697 RepID=A0A101MK17_PENFR|nr:hypothetical protein N7527_011487 [Penicillium freii]KUM61967.1 hypothetical protein ACN42_g5160 [Penicillium freii]
MGKSVIKPDFTPANLNALIKKRIRMERGLPAVVVEVPYGSSPDIDDAPNRDGICCSNGVCAWIEESTDRTTIFHWKLMSLPREEDLFDTAGEVKRQPKHVRLTDDAAIVSLCIHDKTYRATYLPWDFDSKGEIRKVCVPIGPTILITQNGLRSLPVWNDWYIFTGGSNGAGWLLDKRSNTTNRFQGG